ncbi:MAG: carboxypeptidase-like regulatory domain-containing protein [Bauldia sp.]
MPDRTGGRARRGGLPGSGLLVGLALALMALAGCSPSNTMTGIVRDNFGNPIEGVAVSVEKSDYTAVTDKTGRYRVGYEPGGVNIRFAKDGYAPGRFGIRLGKKASQPIDVVVLQKLPGADGLWLVGESGYTRAGTCKLRTDFNTTARTTTVSVIGGEPTVLPAANPPPRVLTFLDTHIWQSFGVRQTAQLYRILGSSQGYEILNAFPQGIGTQVNSLLPRTDDVPAPQTTTASIGRTFTSRLDDGTYVYVGRVPQAGVGLVPDPSVGCFMFVVGKPTGPEFASAGIPAEQLASFAAQVKKCLTAPAGAGRQQVVTMRINLNAEGALAGEPETIRSPTDSRADGATYGEAANQIARAIKECQPYKGFDAKDALYWQSFAWTFDMKALFP